jgi:hypothetical protein
VTINDKVIACDTKKVPLADEALDFAVFSLSLMGKNWHEYITEAKRCIVTNGILIIAETTKSLKGRLSNLRDEIQKQGFDIYSYFYVLLGRSAETHSLKHIILNLETIKILRERINSRCQNLGLKKPSIDAFYGRLNNLCKRDVLQKERDRYGAHYSLKYNRHKSYLEGMPFLHKYRLLEIK